MSADKLEAQLAQWKYMLAGLAGADLTLLIIAIVDGPIEAMNLSRPGGVIISGWYGIWLVLVLATSVPGISILIGRGWRKLPLNHRLNTAFGFLGAGWLALAAFAARTLWMGPNAFHYIVPVLGILLVILYYLLRRRTHISEELFP